MFRIAFLVTRSDTIGGSHIHVRDMGLKMSEDGYQVFILIGGNGPIVNHFKEIGLNVIQIPSLSRNISPYKDVKAYFEIKKVLHSISPDIVSTHSSKAGFLGRIVARRLKIPVLFTAHGWSFTTGKGSVKQSFFKALEKMVAPITDKIITVSEYDKKLALENLSVKPESVVTIHNGMVDINDKFQSAAGKNGQVNLIMIARFDHQKDHIELLQAIQDIENISIHFVGDGPLMKQVDQKAEELGIKDRITFWGRLDSVEEVLAKSHIFALISNWEGFPRSTLEAMRAGLPTVISDVGGAAEAVEDGVTGFVVEKGNVKKLHKVVKKLAHNPSLRKDMGKRARERYEKEFTFEKMYKNTLSVYREMIPINEFTGK